MTIEEEIIDVSYSKPYRHSVMLLPSGSGLNMVHLLYSTCPSLPTCLIQMNRFESENQKKGSYTVWGIVASLRSSTVKFSNSGPLLHQWSGTPAIKSWLNAWNPHGIHAGRQISQTRSFWYRPNSPTCGRRSSKSNSFLSSFSQLR